MQKEFVMEGHRWYDLVRMNKAVMEQVFAGETCCQCQTYHVLFPIPQKELYYNPKLVQNRVYEF